MSLPDIEMEIPEVENHCNGESSVRVAVNEKHEAIEFHHWLMAHAKRPVAVHVCEDEFPCVSLVEYHSAAGHAETLCAYSLCEIWLHHFDENDKTFRFDFDDPREAMLFKLTFGGA